MNRHFQSIKDFFEGFSKKTKSKTSGVFSSGKGYFQRLFKKSPRSKPEKIWCFYPDPYRQGLAATMLTGIGVLTLITIILIVIGVITLIVLLASLLVYALALGLIVGGAAGGAWLGNRAAENGNGGCIGLILGGAIGVGLAEPVAMFGGGVWESGMEFAGNLNLFFTVTSFIGSNWYWILLIILSPAIAVLAFSALTIVAVYLLRVFEYVVLNIYGIRNPCPECAQKTEPAIYFCNACGEKHPHHLIPSQYGILKHKCINGHPLPTLLVLGRNRDIPHQCPNPICNTELTSGAVGIDKHVAFVGGQTSGKTCLLVQVTRQLLTKGAEIPEEEQERDFLTLQDRMEKGQVPDKTSPRNIYRAFQVIFRKGTFPYHIHLYDLAGEKFEHAQDAAAHRFFTLLDSVVFAFDPFSIPEFRKRQSLPSGLGVANQDPLEVIRNLSQVLERYNDKAKIRKINLNILMVKSDMGYLDEFLSPNVEQKQLNEKIREFIISELEQGAFIHHIEQHFGKINYFRVSALGRVPAAEDNSPFESLHLDRTFDSIWKGIKVKVR